MYSVVVPCYNEKDNLDDLFRRFDSVRQKAAAAGRGMELVLVDNGSTDGSRQKIDALAAAHSWIRAVYVDVNQGYGYGILQGLKACAGSYLFWLHADLQLPPEALLTMMDILEGAPDPDAIFLKGERSGRPLSDRFFTRGMGLFESWYLGVPLHDINGQPTGFPRRFFEGWADPPYDFSLDLYAYATAVRQGLRVERVPVVMAQRERGHSSWNTGMASRLRLIARTVRYSRALKKSMRRAARA